LRAISVLLVNVVLVNNILRNRPGGSLTIATQQLLQNFTDLIVALRKAQKSGNTSEAIAALVATEKEAFTSPFQPPFYHTPEKFEAALGKFLRGRSFRGKAGNRATPFPERLQAAPASTHQIHAQLQSVDRWPTPPTILCNAPPQNNGEAPRC